jgi:formimidoylglutamate deiminase
VDPRDLSDAVAAVRSVEADLPIHIHVAEQAREVEACLAWSGTRPVAWLLDHAPVDRHWCLVHATHVDDAEITGIAGSGAVVGLCPTTEANLGDGLFPLSRFAEVDGRWAVGTDAHVGRSPTGELRMLEYGQRLILRERNIAAGRKDRSTGRTLLEQAWRSGAMASGRPVGGIEAGRRADIVVLEADHPSLVARGDDDVLDAWIFSGDEAMVSRTFVGGREVVRDGRHVDGPDIADEYRATLSRLLLRR